MRKKPFLLVDVDGVLNPYARRGDVSSSDWQTYQIAVHSPFGGGPRTYAVALSVDHGRWLTELAADFRLAWATTWEDQANTLIAPKIGLAGPLPVAEVVWRMSSYDKVEGIIELVGDQPCAWLDDDPGRRGYVWRDERLARGIPTLLLVPDPAVGFTQAHKEELHRFAQGESGAPPPKSRTRKAIS